MSATKTPSRYPKWIWKSDKMQKFTIQASLISQTPSYTIREKSSLSAVDSPLPSQSSSTGLTIHQKMTSDLCFNLVSCVSIFVFFLAYKTIRYLTYQDRLKYSFSFWEQTLLPGVTKITENINMLFAYQSFKIKTSSEHFMWLKWRHKYVLTSQNL